MSCHAKPLAMVPRSAVRSRSGVLRRRRRARATKWPLKRIVELLASWRQLPAIPTTWLAATAVTYGSHDFRPTTATVVRLLRLQLRWSIVRPTMIARTIAAIEYRVSYDRGYPMAGIAVTVITTAATAASYYDQARQGLHSRPDRLRCGVPSPSRRQGIAPRRFPGRRGFLLCADGLCLTKALSAASRGPGTFRRFSHGRSRHASHVLLDEGVCVNRRILNGIVLTGNRSPSRRTVPSFVGICERIARAKRGRQPP